MSSAVVQAILKAIAANPTTALALLQELLDLLKANPALVAELAAHYAPKS